tara:strand:+ start:886 stop:1389 length:504 start_codon:yes stop_codon:yes gene_type:complete
MIIIGGLWYFQYQIKPQLLRLEAFEEKEKQETDELKQAFLKVAELHTLVSVTNDILIIANKSATINEHFVKIENMLNRISDSSSSGIDSDTLIKISATLDKVESMAKIVNKHPDNLEVLLNDIRRTVEEISNDTDSLIQNTSTVATQLLTTSQLAGNHQVSLTGIKK